MQICDDRPGSGGRYVATLDDQGILTLAVRGLWSKEDADALFVSLTPLHAEARRRHGAVRMMIRIESVQSPLVAMHVRDHLLAIKSPGDRTAIVFHSILSKLQIGRFVTRTDTALFGDEAAARAWLLD